VHVPTATIILIDFGYSFGASLDLPLPELVPFRLTKIFRELMDPIGVNGIFKASMVYSISALRNNWHQLIDFCDVFINDPVLDWTYIARKKRLVRSAVGNGTASMSQELSEDQTFFKKKIEYVQSKLQGKNPRMLLAYAINESKHREVPGLKKIIEGNKPLKSHVSAAEQVELLIELATDKNILGRAFTPWCPYV
jgi:DNA-dependent protein kinase catalytic subunit